MLSETIALYTYIYIYIYIITQIIDNAQRDIDVV
jgi:hypothetical protein